MAQQTYKSGIKTTEFWVTFLTTLGGLFAAIVEVLNSQPNSEITITSILAVVAVIWRYTQSREQIKISAP